jgi:hypothetical protein
MRDGDMNAVLPFEESLDVAVGEAVDESLAARWEDTTKLRSLLLLPQEAPQLRARWLEEAYGKRDRVAVQSHHFEDAWKAGSCSSMVQQSR